MRVGSLIVDEIIVSGCEFDVFSNSRRSPVWTRMDTPLPQLNPDLGVGPATLTSITQPSGVDPLVTEKISVDAVLAPYAWIFIISFAVSVVFTPILRQIAIYYDVVDRPDPRKMHREPVAYLGGVAVFLGWIVAVVVSQLMQPHGGLAETGTIRMPVWIVLAATVIVLLGLWDDLKSIRPRIKIYAQILAAVILLGAGIGDDITSIFVNNVATRLDFRIGLPIGDDAIWWATKSTSWFIAIGLVVFCCNATNLMDGLDGLASGVTAIIALGYVALAVYIATFLPISDTGRLNVDAVRIVLSVALLGGVLGFIPHNFNPASIFMGDTGSLFLGFMCATIILMLGEVDGRWFLAALVMFSLPVLDTALAFTRRWLKGRSIFAPDKLHFHHQLVARGLSVKQAVLTEYGLAIFFVLAGFSLVFIRTRFAVAFYLVLFAFIVVAAFKIGMVHERLKPEDWETSDTRHGEGDDNVGEGVGEGEDSPAASVAARSNHLP
jgi:UDP-GlcNAc:undecaprenyl-phosphate/decaprenyl-phosphate GlcNAc-1-phosphate transferase